MSNELVADALNPGAAAAVGAGLARDIARKLDSAWAGSTIANGPAGLGSLTTSVVTSGAAFTIDSLIDAIAAAAEVGSRIDHFVVSVPDFVALSKLKVQSGSNLPLPSPDPTKLSGRLALGIPCTRPRSWQRAWRGRSPSDRTYLVVREDTDIEVDSSAGFSRDVTAIRARMRVGFGFPHALGLVKITHT